MLNIELWCPEKPILVKIIAQDMAVAAVSLYESIDLAQQSTIPEHFSLPETKEWFTFYENNHFVEDMSGIFNGKSVGSIILNNTLLLINKEEIIVPEKLKNLSEEEIYQEFLKEIKDDLTDRAPTKEEQRFVKEQVITFHFLFL